MPRATWVRSRAIWQTGIASLMLAAVGARAQAGVIQVPQAVPTIQAGIELAQIGDTVLVAPGTYTGAGNKDLDFFGKDIALIGAGGAVATTIDCGGEGRGLYLANGETRAALIQGLTIRNGFVFNGLNGGDQGGGIYCSADVTFRDVVVQDCIGHYTGGICITGGGSPYLVDCVIENNEDMAGSGGGILICNGSEAEIVDVEIRNNYGRGKGGGAHICYANPRFYGVIFEGNEAASEGGGVSGNGGSQPTFHSCLFVGNHARLGGGLDISGPRAVVENCIFQGNWAAELGGAVYLVDDDGAAFHDCLILGNSAGAGGAVYVGEYSILPAPQFINVTMVGNQSWWVAGSAITANWDGKVDLIDCLLVGNFGGTALWTDHGASINPTCTDVWGNPDGNYCCDLFDLTGIDGNISVDPLYCDYDGDDFTLSGSSPCLPWNNDCGVQMGAFGAGCDLTAVGAPAPPGAGLEANYPNPFNPSTTIPFSLSTPASISLSILDVTGRLVVSLADQRSFPAGNHELHWNGLDAAGQPAPSGVYFYRLETPTGATARPMLLVK